MSCSIGGAGHFNPLRPFIDVLQSHGDEVLVVIPPALVPLAKACDCEFRVGAEPPRATLTEIRGAIATASRSHAAILSERELFGRLCTAAMLPATESAFVEWRPELVLRETCEYSSAVVACRNGVRHAQVAISQGEIEASALAIAAPALEAYHSGVVEQIRSSPFLTRFPSSLDPISYPDTRRYSAWFRRPHAPLANWWETNDSPLVYLTFGSVTGSMSIAAEAYRIALGAMKDLAVRVLLTVGEHVDIAALGPLPDNVHVEHWVPQDEVFAYASLVVCHGGSGTTFGALAWGLPVVLVPMFADQFANARRVASAGAGLLVEPATAEGELRPRLSDRDTARIARAVTDALENTAYLRAAARIAREMASLPSVEEILALVGRDAVPGQFPPRA